LLRGHVSARGLRQCLAIGLGSRRTGRDSAGLAVPRGPQHSGRRPEQPVRSSAGSWVGFIILYHVGKAQKDHEGVLLRGVPLV